ncbi:adenylate/guanylate cyclase domain-containing protein [Sulfitobacter aestuariivivens]|uniref:HAMP domain-containing protein n=1 Tax=Sulfitobacter aestuariivivens TaxID=2766981 RepID=A0A927D3Z3_9RHOB|nr:adenylate/guanylate cyclase domain-containing protein [Sulfitobacter aestuariivivens]MBD3662416.1 HAMP domain-containing protein [Sulfitobacter aestuariivivens]
MWFPLRLKFFFFATLLAVAPLVIVGQNLTQLTRDELKSAANEDLTTVAAQVQNQFDATYQGRWLSPLMVIRNGIDSDELDVPQKVSLLTLGLQELPDVLSLQLAVAGSNLPIMATDQAFSQKLESVGLDPVAILTVPNELIQSIEATDQFGRPLISQLPQTGEWIATLALPLNTTIAGRQVTLAARIELSSLARLVERHPFAQRGNITIIDPAGRTVLVDEQDLIIEREIVQAALPLIVAGVRANTLQAYTRPDGTDVLGALAFPDWFPWAVVTELTEAKAYAVVNAITRQILIVGGLGFTLASIGALFFARQLTGPILKISSVVNQIGSGELSVRVEGVKSRDEIGHLARRVNEMIDELRERIELMKFVSHGTVEAIQSADEGMSRGGIRKNVSVIFTDIRGYTEFSERVAPEVVIEALNEYFEEQTRIVEEYEGDVDKFIGDALVAVFEGDRMEERAVECAVHITDAMNVLLERFPDYNLHVGIGVASGAVVMGAMGAASRMDYTVLGSTVNLSARLCSKAEPDQVLIDTATKDACAGLDNVAFEKLDAIELKGYADPVPTFAATQIKTSASPPQPDKQPAKVGE